MSTEVKDEKGASRASLWRNRDYMLLWNGQLISSLGTVITQTAYPLLVWDISHSAALVGLVGSIGTIPYLFLSLIVGALIDRWDRKRVMILCDIGRTFNLVSLFVALFIGHLTVVQVCLNALIEGTFYVFFNLAEVSCLPQVVSNEQLPLAASQNAATMGITTLLGPLFGGALYSLLQFLPFLADAISYGVSVITLSFIRVPFQKERKQRERKLLVEIREGLSWLWHQPLIFYLALLTGGLNFIYASTVPLLVVLVKQQHGSSLLYGTILMIGGIGGIIGALVGAPIQKRFRFGTVIIGTLWVQALLFPLLAIVPNPLLLGVVLSGFFITAPIYDIVQYSYRLSLIPDELQGRVNSVFRLLAYGFQPLGWAMSGLLIQSIQAVPTILILSACLLLLALLTTFNPHVRRAGRARKENEAQL